MKRSAVKRRKRRKQPGDDARYLNWIRTKACVICLDQRDKATAWEHLPRPFSSMTEAAHVGYRGLGQKCPDRQAIPLCTIHHRTGVDAHHVLGRGFWRHHGMNREVIIAELLAEYAEEGKARREAA